MVYPLNHFYLEAITSFKNDCGKLIDDFKEKHSDDFRDFVPVWKAHKFNLLYEKYRKFGQESDFKEDSLQIAKSIMLNDHFTGGMYLLCGLYYVQEDPKLCIRLQLEEFESITQRLSIARRNMSLAISCQAGFMLAKLLKNDAFKFVKFSREYTLEGQNRARLIFGDLPYFSRDNIVPSGSWMKGFLMRSGCLTELKEKQQEYENQKAKLKKEYPELNLNLNMVPDDFVSDLESCLFLQPESSKATGESIGSKRKKLKNRTLKIKQRYEKKGRPRKEKKLEDGKECSSEKYEKKPTFKGQKSIAVKSDIKKGCPRGKRKSYIKSMINNESSSDSQESLSDSDTDTPLLSLPEI